jgi:hypothetical protein
LMNKLEEPGWKVYPHFRFEKRFAAIGVWSDSDVNRNAEGRVLECDRLGVIEVFEKWSKAGMLQSELQKPEGNVFEKWSKCISCPPIIPGRHGSWVSEAGTKYMTEMEVPEDTWFCIRYRADSRDILH